MQVVALEVDEHRGVLRGVYARFLFESPAC